MDITERKLAEALRDEESHILEMIARECSAGGNTGEAGAGPWKPNLPDCFARSCSSTRNGQHVRHGAAPSLPKGLQPRPSMAFASDRTRDRAARPCIEEKPVVVTDILQDSASGSCTGEKWLNPMGCALCWSVPILAHSGKALGSFAMYYREPAVRGPA